MRAQIAGRLATCCLILTLAPQDSADQSEVSPSSVARRFFDALQVDNASAALIALRPTPVGFDERERILAGLPEHGALEPDAEENGKLTAIEVVLRYHQRNEIFEVKVIDVPQAAIALHARAVLLISRPALRLVSAAELQALVAHEVGHEFFWREYERARERKELRTLQELELKCDGISALTLLELGLDPFLLSRITRKLTRFNEPLGATANAAEYPTLDERDRFIHYIVNRWRGVTARQ